jgi:hypothetical protein
MDDNDHYFDLSLVEPAFLVGSFCLNDCVLVGYKTIVRMMRMDSIELKRNLKSFCRRNRTALKHTYVGEYSAEEVSEMLVDCLGIEEVHRIINDIGVINSRGGNTVKYFMHILEGLKSA